MFVKSFVLLLLANLTMAEIPSYINICGRRNPKLDECIINSTELIRDKLITGIPELEIPKISPLTLKKLIFTDDPNFQIIAENVKIYGVDTFQVINLKTDLKKQQIDTTVIYKQIKIETAYNINTKILVPLVGNGHIKADTYNVTAKVLLRYKLIEKDGKKYMYFFSMTTKLDIKDVIINIEPENNTDDTLREIIRNIFNTNKNDMISIILPSIEKSISENVLMISNNIVKHFHYDEILPDRE
ncbi:uncharacterized protein LOC118444560 [Vespa mandarinia]|uniref:uncharacterized protein LOC118444560 n=1 Tax=Vespa mandarinia TaxID=7446 RepID=UPI0016171326|nr:uncharacterized protein LOC118444560 [Vespa mandarinia]